MNFFAVDLRSCPYSSNLLLAYSDFSIGKEIKGKPRTVSEESKYTYAHGEGTRHVCTHETEDICVQPHIREGKKERHPYIGGGRCAHAHGGNVRGCMGVYGGCMGVYGGVQGCMGDVWECMGVYGGV